MTEYVATATTRHEDSFPSLLREIPDPPEKLYVRGNMPPRNARILAVVGSRNYTDYGKQATETLIAGLQGYNIAVISGLALGIDSIAHKTALRHNLYTLAVPGSGIDDSVLYPAKHRGLAHDILKHGGGLLSEFEPTFQATTWSFPKRNRIMAGLAHATLVIEATEKSGSLITARLTVEYNRELLVVPGSIFSEATKGTHQFLKLGATPVTTPEDIIDMLQADHAEEHKTNPNEPQHTPHGHVLALLTEPMDRDTLLRNLKLSPREGAILLMQLELEGHIIIEQNIVRKARL